MNPAPTFLGIFMLAFAGWPMFYAWAHGERPETLGLLVAAALALAGVMLLLRRPLAFWLGLVAAALMAGLGALGMSKGRQMGLPLPSVLSLVIGLYLMFRTVLARGGLRSRRGAVRSAGSADPSASEQAAAAEAPSPPDLPAA